MSPAVAASGKQAHQGSTVDLCIVAMGKEGAVQEAELLLRSVRATSNAMIAVHLIVSSHTEAAAKALLKRSDEAWLRAEVTRVDTEQVDQLASRVVPGFNTSLHHSGRIAMGFEPARPACTRRQLLTTARCFQPTVPRRHFCIGFCREWISAS